MAVGAKEVIQPGWSPVISKLLMSNICFFFPLPVHASIQYIIRAKPLIEIFALLPTWVVLAQWHAGMVLVTDNRLILQRVSHSDGQNNSFWTMTRVDSDSPNKL
ncbi:hypothetical protein F4808DRAFT_425276 [Astrocystis sublimbata]|nr:hypothetical protein F4808DRAFT_425276 [Astrocystis sublimbata]